MTVNKPPKNLEKYTSLFKRIYISMPADEWLTANQNSLKWGVVKDIEHFGYTPEIFIDPSGRRGLAAGMAWSAKEADRVARRCVGAIIIGLPRWEFQTQQGTRKLATEYCQYEGAIAFTLGLPMLVLVQKDVDRRVIFDSNYSGQMGTFSLSDDAGWLKSAAFTVPFNHWHEKMLNRRDVFLGYCGSSKGTANNLKTYLKSELHASVLDWRTDFAVSGFILQRIQESAARCSAGIFLFTKDDTLADNDAADKAVPRDNVVFEAGMFINAKGMDHVLIIVEKGAKVPTDYGGGIYVTLEDRSDIEPIKKQVENFFNELK